MAERMIEANRVELCTESFGRPSDPATLLIMGIGGLIVTFWAREMPGFWWSLISAALAVLAGLVLLAKPMPPSS